MTDQRLTTQGVSLSHLAHIVLSVAMLGVSIYSLNHFFQELYPTTLGSASGFCDISSFWNCDSATFSPIAQFFLIPISVPSIVLAVYFLIHSLYANDESEQTGKFLALINFIGCICLFLYSLIVLGTLCPVCTLYYVISTLIFILFWRNSSLPAIPSLKYLIPWAIIFAVAAGATYNYHKDKKSRQETVNAQIVQQFFKLPVGIEPNINLSKKLLTSAQTPAPIRIHMFSDFQCPYCKLLAEDLEKAARQFPGKVEAHYFFYPLDSSCNPNIKSAFHQNACRAAYAAYCSQDFKKAHDEIYAHQDDLKGDYIDDFIKDNNLTTCVESKETKEAIVNSIKHGDSKFQVKATPTLIINGVRIKALPKSQFLALFKAILERKK